MVATRRALWLLLPAMAGCGLIPSLDSVIMHPVHEIEMTPLDRGFSFQELTLPIADDRSISIWHVYAQDLKGLVLILPGSDTDKSRYVENLPVFIPKGYYVVIPDYEGFGTSPGEPTLQHAVDDAFALIEYATSNNHRIVLFAFSLGTPRDGYDRI